jgi:hypothetical protein
MFSRIQHPQVHQTLDEGGWVVLCLYLLFLKQQWYNASCVKKTVQRKFLDSVLYVAPVIVPRSRFATNDRSQESGSVRRPGAYATPIRDYQR